MTMRTASMVMALLAALCAGPAWARKTHDPWEGFNRAMFSFNDGLDHWVLEPSRRAGTSSRPTRSSSASRTSSRTSRVPINGVNSLMQGKPVDAASDVGRFTVNTTIGLAGFLDPATYFGLVRHDEDFGRRSACGACRTARTWWFRCSARRRCATRAAWRSTRR